MANGVSDPLEPIESSLHRDALRPTYTATVEEVKEEGWKSSSGGSQLLGGGSQ